MLTNIVSFLLEWITLNTHYDASIFNFEVIELSKNELQALACGGKCPVIAFFSDEHGIFISNSDYNGPCNQSILLHEIIHSFQSDLKIENAFKEKEAYELQNKFLEELSIKNDMIDILNIKKCRSKQSN